MSESGDHPLGPQPSIALMCQHWNGLGNELQKFMNTPQFDANNAVSNTLQQLNTTVQNLSTTVQQISTVVQQIDTRLTRMETKVDTVIYRIDTLEVQLRAR
jgi:uncharacterized protein YoxC